MLIDLAEMDLVTISLLSRKEEDGGLSDECFETIASMDNYTLDEFVEKYPTFESRRCRKHCNECLIVNIGCAKIVVCIKEQKCTVVGVSKI